MDWLNSIWEKIDAAFITENRWMLYLKGVGVTMEVALFAGIIGIILGTIVAFMKLSVKRNGKPTLLSHIANIYIDIIRGTPSVLQLLIMWFVVLASCKNGILVASLTFGINSGAYVAEIVRSGIMSIDAGQFEAGRSLGFNYTQTMIHIILPQALKNVLPALGNEFIVLLKETSVAGYIALEDLTKGADIIRSQTFSPMMPLLAVAAIYLAFVMMLSWLIKVLERRLRNSER